MPNPSDANLYEVLGVSRDAPRADIKKAWMKGVRKHHPDMGGEHADSEAFQRIQEAYDTLSNEESRAEYDDMLDASAKFTTATGQPDTAPSWDAQPRPAADVQWESEDTGPMFRPEPKQAAPAYTAPAAAPARGSTGPKQPNVEPAVHNGVRFETAHRSDMPKIPVSAWRSRIPSSRFVNMKPGWMFTWSAAIVTGALTLSTWFRLYMLTANEPTDLLKYCAIGAALAMVGGVARTAVSRWERKLSHAASITSLAAALLCVVIAAQTSEQGTAIAACVTAAAMVMFGLAVVFGVRTQRATSRVLKYKQVRDFRVFGSPGGHAATEPQRVAQKSTGTKAQEFLEFPNTKIAHNLRTPADPKHEEVLRTAAGEPVKPLGAVDTAVITGKRMLLMDSATVPAGDYSVDDRGVVYASGEPTHASIDALNDARRRWQKKLGKRTSVEAMLVLYPDGPAGTVLTPDLPVAVIIERDAIDTAGKFLSEDVHTVHRKLINTVYAHTSA